MINVDFRINYYLIDVIFLKFRINCKIVQIFPLLFGINFIWMFSKTRGNN